MVYSHLAAFTLPRRRLSASCLSPHAATKKTLQKMIDAMHLHPHHDLLYQDRNTDGRVTHRQQKKEWLENFLKDRPLRRHLQLLLLHGLPIMQTVNLSLHLVTPLLKVDTATRIKATTTMVTSTTIDKQQQAVVGAVMFKVATTTHQDGPTTL